MNLELEKKKNSLFEQVPTVPFVIDVLGTTLKELQEITSHLPEEEQLKLLSNSLDLAIETAKYAKVVSAKNYYQYNVVVAALLFYVKEYETLNISALDTDNNTIKTLLNSLIITEDDKKNTGELRALLLKLVRSLKADENVFVILTIELFESIKRGDFNNNVALAWLVDNVRPLFTPNNTKVAVRESFDNLVKYAVNSKF